MNTYEAFERERLRLLAETNKFLLTVTEQKPMTREEAKKIANDKWPHGPNVVAVLEALGLLKFDEVPTAEEIIKFNFDSIGIANSVTLAKGTINHLKRCGYKIVKD